MIDVHLPQHKIQGIKDFFLHLFTITVGLLIALSLEGCMEWQHHRHLAREAEVGLHEEIARNAKVVGSLRQQIQEEQKQLDADIEILNKARMDSSSPHQKLTFEFSMHTFDDVTWKTAQTTGAFQYVPYDDARAFSKIYTAQEDLYQTQQELLDDVMRAGALVATRTSDWQPTPLQIDAIIDRTGVVKMRLSWLETLVDSLDKTYQDFEATHTKY
jgi:hypothetical protein